MPEFTYKGVVLHPQKMAFAPTGVFERACLIKMEGRGPNPLGKYYLYFSPHKPVGIGLRSTSRANTTRYPQKQFPNSQLNLATP